MINKRTVFVLGAGASCPYGYPTAAQLRELICFEGGFRDKYFTYLTNSQVSQSIRDKKVSDVKHFIKIFKDSNIKSIDVFMANNPKLAPTGKYVIAYEIFRAEINSYFGEEAKRRQELLTEVKKNPDRKRELWGTPGFYGGDWYFYLYNKAVDGLVGKDALPDFSNGNISFITFNYDRSLEQFLYESLRNSFSEVSEEVIIKALQWLKILHVYGQIAPLKWQNPQKYFKYKPQVNEDLLQSASENLRTIYEEKENPELTEAKRLLQKADQIFFLGFGYNKENMEVLGLPELIQPECIVYGTAFNMITEEVKRLHSGIHKKRAHNENAYVSPEFTIISDVDCLMLLRKYLK